MDRCSDKLMQQPVFNEMTFLFVYLKDRCFSGDLLSLWFLIFQILSGQIVDFRGLVRNIFQDIIFLVF